MNYRPCFYKAALTPREIARNQLHTVHSIDRGRVLIIRMEVRSMVLSPGFRVHTYDNA